MDRWRHLAAELWQPTVRQMLGNVCSIVFHDESRIGVMAPGGAPPRPPSFPPAEVQRGIRPGLQLGQPCYNCSLKVCSYAVQFCLAPFNCRWKMQVYVACSSACSSHSASFPDGRAFHSVLRAALTFVSMRVRSGHQTKQRTSSGACLVDFSCQRGDLVNVCLNFLSNAPKVDVYRGQKQVRQTGGL